MKFLRLFHALCVRRPFSLARRVHFRFSTAEQAGEPQDFGLSRKTVAARIGRLRALGHPPDQLNLYAHLSELPFSSALSAQARLFDELFSQLIDLREMMALEKPDSDDFRFFQAELDALTAHVQEEYERVLPEAVRAHFQSEMDAVEGAILEFRAGVGGAESLLFAEEMSAHYQHYLALKGFSTQQLSSTSQGGKVVAYRVRGEGVYRHIIHEAGVHKVIRVPETEAKGRLHSSVISLVVLPDVPFEFRLNEKELRFEYMRAQGPGGQHVNKTESACRVTHVPSGVSVMMQDDRSQENNRRRALELIREKLYQIEFEKKISAEMQRRKSQIGTSDRSDKIRTYNFPQDRITDHRLGKTVFGIEAAVNSGSIFDECIAEMQARQEQEEVALFNEMLRERYK